VICYWLWTATARIPSRPTKDVGLGLTLPLYVSGPQSVGWWAVFITMLADFTAFASLVFGYFFYWTLHEDFPPAGAGPGLLWPAIAAVLLLTSWLLTLGARRWNENDRPLLFYLGGIGAVVLAVAGGAALLAGPLQTGLDPKSGVYAAIVWVLVAWTTFHVAIGIIMNLYCVARRAAGRMTARHALDIGNVALYWHFLALTVAITVGVISGFPLVK
jgi:cytochrome c oxidase subunit I+III